MQIAFNPLTGKFDIVGMSASEIAAYLKLDQTTPQTIINGAPIFDGGATDAIVITAGKRLVFDGA